MAITAGQQFNFVFGTSTQFAALKTAGSVVAGDLYFLTDTHQIYVGEELYTGQTLFVDAFSETPSQGIIYVHKTTHEAKVWNGAAWDVMVPAISGDLATAADTDLVNAKAIKDFISKGVGADAVNDVAYDAATQKFTVTYGDATTSELPLKNLLTGAAYDATTGDFTFTVANGEAVVINTPKENFLSAANFNAETNELTLTLVDGTEVDVNLAELIDVYTVKNSATVNLTMTGNEIVAAVNKSSAAGNILTLNDDGLFVPGDFIQSIEDTATIDIDVTDAKLTANVKLSAAANNALVANEDGLHVDISGKADKAETLAGYGIGDAYTKTEIDELLAPKANAATSLEGYGITDAYTKDEVDAITTWKTMA